MKTNKDPKCNSQRTRHFNFIRNNNVNLNQNSQFQFAKRHALSIYPSGSIYSFIPKNGCTTLRTSLANANGFFDHNEPEDHINWIHNNTYTFTADLPELIKAQYTFTVLRCPFDRLASLFLDKFLDKTPVAWNFYRLSNNKFNLDTLNFHDFVNELHKRPNLLSGDIHWRKQTDFLLYKEYDDYFDFNNFDKIKQVLSKKIDLDLIDTRKITNHGREKHQTVDGDFSRESINTLKVLKDRGELPRTECLYNPETKQKVLKLYESDFTTYNEKAKKTTNSN